VKISDLKKNMSEMDEDELREHIRRIRADRRITKTSPKVRKNAVRREATTGKRAANQVNKVTKLLEGLTPEQIAELMKQVK
jgi:hypothetical protein